MDDSYLFFTDHDDRIYQHPYHQHGRARTLRQAVKSIKNHDIYQIKVRGHK